MDGAGGSGVPGNSELHGLIHVPRKELKSVCAARIQAGGRRVGAIGAGPEGVLAGNRPEVGVSFDLLAVREQMRRPGQDSVQGDGHLGVGAIKLIQAKDAAVLVGCVHRAREVFAADGVAADISGIHLLVAGNELEVHA